MTLIVAGLSVLVLWSLAVAGLVQLARAIAGMFGREFKGHTIRALPFVAGSALGFAGLPWVALRIVLALLEAPFPDDVSFGAFALVAGLIGAWPGGFSGQVVNTVEAYFKSRGEKA